MTREIHPYDEARYGGPHVVDRVNKGEPSVYGGRVRQVIYNPWANMSPEARKSYQFGDVVDSKGESGVHRLVYLKKDEFKQAEEDARKRVESGKYDTSKAEEMLKEVQNNPAGNNERQSDDIGKAVEGVFGF